MKLVKPRIYVEVSKLSPEGVPPLPRYLHSASYFSTYLAIFGGRNDSMYSTIKNVALNDLHLYDLTKNAWITVGLYG